MVAISRDRAPGCFALALFLERLFAAADELFRLVCEGLAPDVTVREAVAKRIIVAAKGGERDVERLIKYGLGKDDMLADAGAQRGQERLASQ